MDPSFDPDRQIRSKRRHDPSVQSSAAGSSMGDRGKAPAGRGRGSRGCTGSRGDRAIPATTRLIPAPSAREARVRGKRPATLVPDTPERLEVSFGPNQSKYEGPPPCVANVRTAQGYTPRLYKDYKNKAKEVTKQRKENPWFHQKDESLDPRFHCQFHSDFYFSVLYEAKRVKIIKMQWIDWKYMEERRDRVFDRVI